ncbi:MAG: 8-oxoguanine deaminase [Spirochaetota bacterium]
MIVLRNCYYLDSPEVADPSSGWDLLLNEGRIERIALDIEEPVGSEVIDCSHHVVVPGFVNTHHHFFQTLTRNLRRAQNAKLFDWLVYHYEIWKHLDAQAIRVSTLLACAELLKTGCTCTTDHHYLYPGTIASDPAFDLAGIQFEAAGELGIRFSPSRGSMSLGRGRGGLPPDSCVQDEAAIIEDSRRVIEQYHDPAPAAMRKVTLAPCSPFSVGPDLMRESARLARAHGVLLHTHLAETADEDDYCLETYGKRPLALMEEWEFIGSDVSYAHGVHFTDEEISRLAETGTGVCHCPSSNMRLGSGIARVSEMLCAGVPVSIGVDGSASNDSSDYLGELRMAMLLQRVRYGADSLGAREVLSIGSQQGARMLGFVECGELRTGWAADLAAFDVHGLEYAGAQSDPLAAPVFAGIGHQSDYTIVDGRVVVERGRLTGTDEGLLAAEANHAAAALLATR